jgi:hypothetical protein
MMGEGERPWEDPASGDIPKKKKSKGAGSPYFQHPDRQ